MNIPTWVIDRKRLIVLFSGTNKECKNFIMKYQPRLPDYTLELW